MTLIIFLIVLSILVLVHEAGHFLAARSSGVRVEEFGLGFPPRLWSKKLGETIYSINILPIGGFVRLYGEEGAVKNGQGRAFYHQGKLTRAKIIVAGVLMNFLLSIAAFGAIGWARGFPQDLGRVEVLEIAKNSPAELAGIQKNDIILSVDGTSVNKTDKFVELVNARRGQETRLVVRQVGGSELTVVMVPRIDPPEGEGALGVLVSSAKILQPLLWQRPFYAVWFGTREAYFWAKTTVLAVGEALGQVIRGQAPAGIAGPVGIFQITGNIAREGIFALLSFLGILSVNLAVLNILPFPALDGGRLLFIGVETIFGRRVVPTFERMAHTVGMVILLLLLLLITIYDINRLINGGFVLH